MKVIVKKVTSWGDVLNSARFTQGKSPIDKEPSEKFKMDMIRAEHSPIRCLVFTMDFYDIPYYVSVHLCRHVHAQPFVSTSRPDRNGEVKPREAQLKSDPVNMRLWLNAQEIINISKVRLCNRAEAMTKRIWAEALDGLMNIDPVLAKACVPSCIHRGFCPEIEGCKAIEGQLFQAARDNYISQQKG